jgi:predicted CoA-binding protein
MDLIKTQLTDSKYIAIIGLSQNLTRDSHKVAEYLQINGYKIIPVNKAVTQILGEACYPDLRSIPFKIDMANIFRDSDMIPQMVAESIEIGVKHIWMQDGIINNEAYAKAEAAGLTVTMDNCIMREHLKYFGGIN